MWNNINSVTACYLKRLNKNKDINNISNAETGIYKKLAFEVKEKQMW